MQNWKDSILVSIWVVDLIASIESVWTESEIFDLEAKWCTTKD